MQTAGKNERLSIVGRRVDITPRHPVILASSPYPHASRGVIEPLEANLLLLRHGRRSLLLATLDLLYPGPWVRSALETTLGTGDAADLLVGASHTHYAPSTLDDKPLLGHPDGRYVDWLVDRLQEAVRELLARPGDYEAPWSAAVTKLDHSINRRRLTERGVKMAPNPYGSRDEDATLLVIGPHDSPLAAIWNYACHPVSHPRPDMIAAHFPGVVRDRLRRKWGKPDLPVLFLQGFSGDTRPSPTTRIRRLKDVASRARIGPGFYDMGARDYRTWTDSLATEIEVLSQKMHAVSVPRWRSTRIGSPLSHFVRGGADGKSVYFQRVDLGSDISIVGGSAEFVSEFTPIVRDLNPHRKFLLRAGCLDDTFGYLTAPSTLDRTGYEYEGFCRAFSYAGVTGTGQSVAVDMFQRLRARTEHGSL